MFSMQTMKIHEAFDQTLKTFNIQASDLAKSTGLKPSEISRFRKGHSMFRVDNFFLLLKALPLPASMHCVILILSNEDGTYDPAFSEARGKI